ncbi:MAG: hypothetical protein AAGH60_07685 [Pseudomonadota bacterium]
MPNLPAAVGRWATALVGNAASANHIALAETLFSAVGRCVVLPDKDMMHLVTGLSGSGPRTIAVTFAWEHKGVAVPLA